MSLQMLLTESTNWHMIASPPTWLNWHITVTGHLEQGSWSAGKPLGNPVCELLLFFCPHMFFLQPRSLLLFFFLLSFRTAPQTQDQLTWLEHRPLKHNGKMTLKVKQLPWVSCILLVLRGVEWQACVCKYLESTTVFSV